MNREEQFPVSGEFSGETGTAKTDITDATDTLFDSLDRQLARLMLQLNESGNQQTDTVQTDDNIQNDNLQNDNPQNDNPQISKILEQSVLSLSQHTREGQIAMRCSSRQCKLLHKTRVVGSPGEYRPLILDDGFLYLERYWHYQEQLAQQIRSRLSSRETIPAIAGKPQDRQPDDYLTWIRSRLQAYFGQDNLRAQQNSATAETNWQQVAAALALIHPFLVLSGGPGTGKTTTITRILALLVEQAEFLGRHKTGQHETDWPRIVLAAPTGKAAIRMLEAIQEAQQKLELPALVKAQMPSEAMTIHKLLGVIPDSTRFRHDENYPLTADIVLIDEASMVDLAMMTKLVSAVAPQARLILIGDRDQLASVETGSVFADICGQNAAKNYYSPAIEHYLAVVMDDTVSPSDKQGNPASEPGLHDHIVTLQKNWRFSEDSGISQLALACNAADSERLIAILHDEKFADCNITTPELLSDEDLVGAWQSYLDLLAEPDTAPQKLFAAFNRHRILCALRKGWLGSGTINQRVEYILGKRGLIDSTATPQSPWYHGRPVMITRNSYRSGLYNGDVGIALRDSEGHIQVWFQTEGGEFNYLSPVRLPAHETAWTMTIHKSQGSEFDHVTLILPQDTLPILKRQLIYTGITRARLKVNLVASESVLRSGVQTDMAQATRIEDKLK